MPSLHPLRIIELEWTGKHHFPARFRGYDSAPQAGECVGCRTFGFLDGEEYRLLLCSENVKVAIYYYLDRGMVHAYAFG